MIDGADREDHEADARDPEVDVEDAGEDTGEAADASEDQPAMALVGGSDEGGTVGDDSVDEDEAPLDEAEQEPDYANEDLGLVSDDDALPWLESSDYDDIESVDAWRITGFVVLGLVALALLVGGIWYFTNRGEEGEPVADGVR